ncbi:exported hypothetical protein [Candidatus Sulfopaludibacter sp. SbA3]|nr:exported hypothetical protein [Candidatus Sulfopaludibacter sp. SbA3]
MIVLCLTDQTKKLMMRLPYLYITLACVLVALFVSANRTAVGLSLVSAAILFVSEGGRHSFRFLARTGVITVLALMITGAYHTASTSDVLADPFRALTSFFSGLLDAPGPDVHGSRYSVIGIDILHGIELSLAELGSISCTESSCLLLKSARSAVVLVSSPTVPFTLMRRRNPFLMCRGAEMARPTVSGSA